MVSVTELTANMSGLSASASYAERLEAFRKSDAERDEMVAEVIKELEKLKVEVAEKTDDLNNEIASRRMWQSKATQSEQALAQHKQVSVCVQLYAHAQDTKLITSKTRITLS